MNILIENDWIGEIPLLCTVPSATANAPLVFYIHGYGSGKESGLALAYQLARAGFFVVSFDAQWHGERFDDRIFRAAEPELGGVYPPETGLDVGATFYQVIAHCLDDVRTLLDHFAGDPRIDVTRCGVTGHSMGAYASFLVFANFPQMHAAVPMMGIPDFDRRWQDILDECAYSNAAWAAAIATQSAVTQQHSALIRSINPYPLLPAAAPRALLMMNGDFDCDQPKSYSIAAYRELRPAWATHPEKLKLNIYPAGHTITAEMERDVVAWFVTHLQSGPSV